MGKIKPYPLVKYICAVTVNDLKLWEKVQGELQALLSPIDLMSSWFPFIYTNYYTAEMGEHLQKRFVAFQMLRPAEALPSIKVATNIIEETISGGSQRSVNLDPGYVTAARLVLATTKDYSHRLYLGQGIFGDVHLRYRNKQFEPMEWTYPDYREPFARAFFVQVRDQYLQQLGEIGEQELWENTRR